MKRQALWPWFGEIPENWLTKPLGAVADCLASNVDKRHVEGEHPVRLCNYTDVYKNDYVHPGMNLMRATASEREIARFGLLADDVIITKDSESWEDIGVPAFVTETSDDFVCGYHLALLRPKEGIMLGRFLFRLLQSRPVQAQMELAAKGVTRFGLSKSDIRKTLLPVPPLSTQAAIADHIDRETERLDKLAATKQRLLDLLAEKHRAVVAHAVTRGLDSRVRLKPSGVEQLGDVPEHWSTRKVAHGFGTIGSGTTPKTDNPIYYGGSTPWVTTSELRERRVDDTAQSVTLEAIRDYPTLTTYTPGTLLFAMYGATIGRMGILGVSATVNQACLALADPIHFNTRFVYYWFQMRRPTLIRLSAGGGQPNLSQEILRQIRIPVPSVDEQRAIANYLDRETERLAVLSARTSESINLLKERRTALISSAVTGDVAVGDGVETSK